MEWAAIWKVIGIRGSVAIGLAIALGVVMWRADAISGQRDEWQRKAVASDLKLSISNASIAELQASLSRYVGAGKAAKVAQLASIERQAKDNAALQAQADAIRAEMAAIGPSEGCDTPDAIRSAKGL